MAPSSHSTLPRKGRGGLGTTQHGSATSPNFTARDISSFPRQSAKAAPAAQALTVPVLSIASAWPAPHKMKPPQAQPGLRGGNEHKGRKESSGPPHCPAPEGFNSTTMLWGTSLSWHSPDRLEQHRPALPKEYSLFLLVTTAPCPQPLRDPSGAIPGQPPQAKPALGSNFVPSM